MNILVTGATGFIGTALSAALVGEGHVVLAGTRRPESYVGPGEAVRIDVTDPAQVRAALRGCTAAYFLVHAMAGGANFGSTERRAAATFATEAARQDVKIIYLGGLGSDQSPPPRSAHLRSRRAVGDILGAAASTVELQAPVVIGNGSAAFELIRLAVDWFPLMVVPEWITTRAQPIALDDMIHYLVAALNIPGGRYQVGGPEVLTYEDMIRRYAKLTGRRRTVGKVPVVAPTLAAAVLSVVSEVVSLLPACRMPGPSLPLALRLAESLPVESVVSDDRMRHLVPFPLLGFDDAVRRAEAQRPAHR